MKKKNCREKNNFEKILNETKNFEFQVNIFLFGSENYSEINRADIF